MSKRISDDAVIKRTGKDLKHWFKVIDKFNCKKNGHKATAKYLNEKHDVDGWYSQMLTVEYERENGLRDIHEKTTGYAVSASRTINAPVEDVYDAWAKPSKLNKWFTTGAKQTFREGGKYSNNDKDKGEFRKIVKNKRIRFTWENEKHCPGTIVQVSFDKKGKDKTTITVQHEKLPDRKGRDDMKTGWSWAMDSLKSWLEKGKAIPYEEWEKARQK
jgi:uncharacterized protein YndB with AHSA1/START domain